MVLGFWSARRPICWGNAARVKHFETPSIKIY
jgi:hypothetical protein